MGKSMINVAVGILAVLLISGTMETVNCRSGEPIKRFVEQQRLAMMVINDCAVEGDSCNPPNRCCPGFHCDPPDVKTAAYCIQD